MLSLFLLFCLLLPALAMAERRVALVPAAEDCRRCRHKLNNRLADALAAQGLLSGLSFEITVKTIRDLKRMRHALEDFREAGVGAALALAF